MVSVEEVEGAYKKRESTAEVGVADWVRKAGFCLLPEVSPTTMLRAQTPWSKLPQTVLQPQGRLV